MKKLLWSTAVAMTLMVSCNDKEESSKMKEVMAVHDEVMPKMGKLGKLVGELKAKENDSTGMGATYKKARVDLQEANEEMMDWMQNFGDRFTHDEILNGEELSEEQLAWLDEEEKKMKALRDKINRRLAIGDSLLGN